MHSTATLGPSIDGYGRRYPWEKKTIQCLSFVFAVTLCDCVLLFHLVSYKFKEENAMLKIQFDKIIYRKLLSLLCVCSCTMYVFDW